MVGYTGSGYTRSAYTRSVFSSLSLTVGATPVQVFGLLPQPLGQLSIVSISDGEDVTFAVTDSLRFDGTYTVTSAALQAGPVNIVPPSVDGTGELNTPLTARSGLWVHAGDPPVLEYQWQLNGVDLDEMISPVYIPTDAGGAITVKQTATNTDGSSSAVSASIGGAVVVPRALAILDYHDLSTMWQDVARTIPVTVAGQEVRYVDDLSGNGNDIFFTNAADAPTLAAGGGLQFTAASHQFLALPNPLIGAGAEIVFIQSIQTTKDWFAICPTSSNGTFAGAARGGSTSSGVDAGFGSPTYRVDGSDVTPVTQGSLHSAIADGSVKTVALSNLTIPADTLRIGSYFSPSIRTDGVINGTVITEPLDAGQLATAEAYMDRYK